MKYENLRYWPCLGNSIATLAMVALTVSGCSSPGDPSVASNKNADLALSCAAISAEAHHNNQNMLENALETEKLSNNNSGKLAMMLFAPIVLVPALFLGGSVSAELSEKRLNELGERNRALGKIGERKKCDNIEFWSEAKASAQAHFEWRRIRVLEDESNLNDGPDFGERSLNADGISPKNAPRANDHTTKGAGRVSKARLSEPINVNSRPEPEHSNNQGLIRMFLRGEITQDEYNARRGRSGNN